MIHADAHLGDYFRVFTQFKSGLEEGRNGGPRPTDRDDFDLNQAFFDAREFWAPGEYTARLMATCKPARASVVRNFRFTLFESDVQDLRERTGRYRYGFGVYLTDNKVTEVYPRIQGLA